MFEAPSLLKAIHAPLDRNQSFVLPSGQHQHICELLQGCLDLCDPLVHAHQLCPRAIIRSDRSHQKTNSCEDAANQNMIVE